MAVVASIIDNDGMLYTDQIVGGVGEEGLPAMGAGPARRRIGWGDELGRDLGRCPEGRIVQHGPKLRDRPSTGVRRQANPPTRA